MESENAKKKRVLEQLRKRMAEFDRLKEKLEEKNIPSDASPGETEGLMEEIRVPPLRVLKEEKKPLKKESESK